MAKTILELKEKLINFVDDIDVSKLSFFEIKELAKATMPFHSAPFKKIKDFKGVD